MKKQFIQIAVTTDYTLFNYLPMNRNIDAKQVEALVESIRAMGLTRQVICIKTNCIDGELKMLPETEVITRDMAEKMIFGILIHHIIHHLIKKHFNHIVKMNLIIKSFLIL